MAKSKHKPLWMPARGGYVIINEIYIAFYVPLDIAILDLLVYNSY